METFTIVYESLWFQAILKLVLGALLTGVIGLERSSLNKPAGFGTHALLGVSAVLVVLSSEYLSLYHDIDMSRIPAQLLSGIGFIGAGTILRNGLNVKGVTTAAGLLSVTCIGLAIGAGYYIGGILATIIVYLILAYSHNISDKFERFSPLNLEISIKKEANSTIKEIETYFEKNKMNLKGISRSANEDDNNASEIIEVFGDYDARVLKKSQIITDLISIKNINAVNEED